MVSNVVAKSNTSVNVNKYESVPSHLVERLNHALSPDLKQHQRLKIQPRVAQPVLQELSSPLQSRREKRSRHTIPQPTFDDHTEPYRKGSTLSSSPPNKGNNSTLRNKTSTPLQSEKKKARVEKAPPRRSSRLRSRRRK